MKMLTTLNRDLLERLYHKAGGELQNKRAFVGYDGFVDEIIHVVDQRMDENRYSRVRTIRQYGKRILGAAGLSSNIEYVTVMRKMGGNGTIFANALLNYGQSVTYIGALGDPPESIFAPIVERSEVYSVAEAAHTDAVEFEDGKLIISKLESFKNITFERIVNRMGLNTLIQQVENSTLVAFANWTMVTAMTDIFKGFLAHVSPNVSDGKFAFFDLADPEKRSKEDLAEALRTIGNFEPKFRAILGLNLREAKQVAAVFGAEVTQDLEQLARMLAERMGIYAVVIHPVQEACALVGSTFYRVAGPYCEHPVLTTGAGDNFNAGFCMGLMQGWEIDLALQLGTMTSGYYVCNAHSPNPEEILKFILQCF